VSPRGDTPSGSATASTCAASTTIERYQEAEKRQHGQGNHDTAQVSFLIHRILLFRRAWRLPRRGHSASDPTPRRSDGAHDANPPLAHTTGATLAVAFLGRFVWNRCDDLGDSAQKQWIHGCTSPLRSAEGHENGPARLRRQLGSVEDGRCSRSMGQHVSGSRPRSSRMLSRHETSLRYAESHQARQDEDAAGMAVAASWTLHGRKQSHVVRGPSTRDVIGRIERAMRRARAYRRRETKDRDDGQGQNPRCAPVRHRRPNSRRPAWDGAQTRRCIPAWSTAATGADRTRSTFRRRSSNARRSVHRWRLRAS
jgi:hypothetical protein